VSAVEPNCSVPIEVAGASMATVVLGAVSNVATSVPLGAVPVDQLAPVLQSGVVPIQVASAPMADLPRHEDAAAVVPSRMARRI
jgi:hypothetical protein